MRQSIPEKVRQQVVLRAGSRCEYCRIHSDDLFLSFEIDHIIPVKHGGSNDLDNLALACPHCNQHKGSDFATILENDIVRLFNPRTDNWDEHYQVTNGLIASHTKIGTASIKIFRFNHPDLVILRQLLIQLGRYP
ncbi:HNH endonuclease [Arsenicibacter rosenii]|uniref:HNH endonuclease n=1 Tax=Arsenicibacter rosenii TaxID=1750698 RepID=UPI0009F70018|nr:HNH endonuclease signature motif containing protein [Arsenicibacter rosenii]